jgi:5-methylcytosine-specific restriction endonuclease McrA
MSAYGYYKIKMRQRLSEAQNHRCCYCHVRFSDDRASPYYATLEHVIPISRGGSNNLKNLVVACEACNNIRGSRYKAEEFGNLIQHGRLGLLMNNMHFIFDKIKANEELAT